MSEKEHKPVRIELDGREVSKVRLRYGLMIAVEWTLLSAIIFVTLVATFLYFTEGGHLVLWLTFVVATVLMIFVSIKEVKMLRERRDMALLEMALRQLLKDNERGN